MWFLVILLAALAQVISQNYLPMIVYLLCMYTWRSMLVSACIWFLNMLQQLRKVVSGGSAAGDGCWRFDINEGTFLNCSLWRQRLLNKLELTDEKNARVLDKIDAPLAVVSTCVLVTMLVRYGTICVYSLSFVCKTSLYGPIIFLTPCT
jgi:hypothetical protein